ncbi:MAG: hypothetical protein AB1896_18185, partial [Thermodesulfobacteriota bacterium]
QGGEGSGVYPVRHRKELAGALENLASLEAAGRKGFIQQELVDTGGRDLRVAVIGDRTGAYWRRAENPGAFATNLAAGGRADFDSDPRLVSAGIKAVRDFAARGHIDLAGFDLMFERGREGAGPLFIEINWFFGRRALGGGEAYYRLLKAAARKWLRGHGLKVGRVRSRPKFSPRD